MYSNNTDARVLHVGSLYDMTIKLFCNRVFVMKMSRFCQMYATLLRASFHKI